MDGIIIYTLKLLFITGTLLTGVLVVRGQGNCRIYGSVSDSGGDRLQGAVIVLLKQGSRHTVAFTLTNSEGNFNIHFDAGTATAYILKVEHIGYRPDSVSVSGNQECNYSPFSFMLLPRANQLKEVVIKAQTLPFSVRGDTIEFNARSYINPESKKVGDLLANIPGFQVTPDGKISFNGKEVEKILIEGEDLADKNYQLISRNLNAGYINKVQVLKNFNEDRLMKDVSESEKIGINLTLDSKTKNRLSGTVEAGVGTRSRVSLDNSNILIGSAVKLLSFFNYNNTGELSNANLQYYYNRDLNGNQVGLQGYDESGLVSAGTIYPPDLPARYVRNNNDLSGAVIVSMKAGKYVSLRLMSGYENSKIAMESQSLQRFELPDGEQWNTAERLDAGNTQRNLLTGLTLNHDRKKNNTGSVTIEWIGQKPFGYFINKTSGAFTDSLHEQISTSRSFLKLNGFESFKLASNKILNLRYQVNHEKSGQNFNAYTTRFLKFFSLDSSWLFNYQILDENAFHADISAGIYRNLKKTEYAVSARTIFQQRKFGGYSEAADTGLLHKQKLLDLPASFSSMEQSFTGSILINMTKKLSYTGSMKAGILWMSLKPDGFAASLAPVLKHFSRLLIKLKPFSSFNADYEFRYGLSPYPYIYPVSLISGNATILNPATEIRKPAVHQLSLHYVSNNLKRSETVLIQASATFADHEYRYGSDIQQEYSSLFYRTFNANRFLNISANLEKFILALKMKVGFQINAFQMRTGLYINELPSTSELNNIRIEGKFNSGFRSAFNFELNPSVSRIRNMTRQENGDWSGQSFWQFRGSGKLKYSPVDKWYFALVYFANQLSQYSFFQTLDFFSQFKANNRFLFTVNLHNLFNAGNLIQRQWAPTFYGEQGFGLMGRYLLLKVNWGF